MCSGMIGENQQLVTNTVEFEKQLVEFQNCRKITDHFRGIYIIYPSLIKENRRMSTCNRLDLQTLGSWPIKLCLKTSPDHKILAKLTFSVKEDANPVVLT